MVICVMFPVAALLDSGYLDASIITAREMLLLLTCRRGPLNR